MEGLTFSILVTGAGGFVGRNVLGRMLQDGREVACTLRNKSSQDVGMKKWYVPDIG